MKQLPLIHQLFEIGAIQFGSFQLKSGITSPVYIDLRRTISFPSLLIAIGQALWDAVQNVPCSLICGVPYTALPFATAISIQRNIPMVMRRKEKKEYGTGKLIEGVFRKGETCLLIEDVITSGQSLLETAQPLEYEGLIVRDIAVLVDREQGGAQALREKGYRVHAVCTLNEIVVELLKAKKISPSAAEQTLSFLQASQIHG